MARVLVSGGAGFIGSHLVAALVRDGESVRVIDNLATGRRENLADFDCGAAGSGAQVEWVEGSVVDPDACSVACDGVHTIFHEAAQVSVPYSVEAPEASYAVNVSGTLHLLEAARTAGVERVVFAGSSAAYGDSEELPKVESMIPRPLSPYASGKVAGEHLMAVWGEVYGLRTAALRYFNVFGPRQADDSPYTGVIAIFARALLEGRRPTIYGDGEQTRDFTFIDNVVEANLLASRTELPPGCVINVGGGERISINQLYRAVAETLESELEPHYEPARQGDVRHSMASLERARELLGWRPRVDWREGLARTVAWYRDRHRAGAR